MKSNSEQVKLSRAPSAQTALDGPRPGVREDYGLRETKAEARSVEAADARPEARVLYLTFDGLLEPLGRSQVLSYLFGLSARGFRFALISLEKERDLADRRAVERLERELRERNILWVRLPYHSGGIKSVLKNCASALRAARRAIREERVGVTHARSYVAGLVGWILRRLYGIPYIFDMRGYWIDELRDEGRWFNSAFAYRAGKLIERRLVRDAAALVTLTKIQADDLRAGLLKKYADRPVEVITTCADYEEFDRARVARAGVVPEDALLRLKGKLVVGLVGSINTSYALAESFLLFRHLLEERADAHLLCLTRQTEQMRALLREQEIPESAYTLASVNHGEMAEWLRLMDWALLLLNTRFSKRGSMPTKLAEFFAAGVRPIQYGCNAEVSEKVREAGSGLVLDGLSPEDLKKGAHRVAIAPLASVDVERARQLSRSHFSLEAGVKKYEKLLSSVEKGSQHRLR